MWPFKKKNKPLNNSILLKYRHEALGRLRFFGGWSGYWETTIDGVSYRSERVPGLREILGDYGNFIIDAILDRVRLRRHPERYREDFEQLRYGGVRYVKADGSVEQWHW
jgi:hypothetical protein